MGILFLFFLRMSYAIHIFLSHLRNIFTIFPLVEAYLERHHRRNCLVPEVLDGVFIHESQYTPLEPNEKEQIPWLLIIHKATKCLLQSCVIIVMRLGFYIMVVILVELIILTTRDMDTHGLFNDVRA
jgi:hypothetical protein